MEIEHLSCHHCGQRIRERSDDWVLHRKDRTATPLFFHDDGYNGECTEAAYAEHERLGVNEWWLTQRPYAWTPEAAELLERNDR